jgi:hypothetical protein
MSFCVLLESGGGFHVVLGALTPIANIAPKNLPLMDPTPLSHSQYQHFDIKIATSAFISIYLVFTTSRFRADFFLPIIWLKETRTVVKIAYHMRL